MNSKQEHKRFAYAVAALLRRMGGTFDSGIWKLDTNHGPLHLRIDTHSTGPGSVFACFKGVERARVLPGTNNGEWNHHFGQGWSIDEALERLEFALKLVTI